MRAVFLIYMGFHDFRYLFGRLRYPAGGDVATIMRQQDDHRGFRVQLDDKRPIIESALLAGRNFLQREGADMTPPDRK